MIAIQILLITGVIAILLWLLVQPKSHQVRAWIKILALLFAVLAIVVVISPDTSNRMAHLVGVGRGADLLLYALTLAFMFVVLNLYIGDKDEQKRQVTLARKVALLEAKLGQRDRKADRANDEHSSPGDE